jgi:hypothetical protein
MIVEQPHKYAGVGHDDIDGVVRLSVEYLAAALRQA